jgi:sialidase-1
LSPNNRSIAEKILFCTFLGSCLIPGRAYCAKPFLTQTAVYHAKDGGYFIHRIPALLTTKKGTILAFCEARRGSAADAAPTDVVLRRSFDNGKTWTPAQIVAHRASATVGNPTPVQDRRTGVIWLLLTSNPAGVTEKEIDASSPTGTRTVWITHSNDDGATWSPLTNITSSTKKPNWTWYATGPGNGIQLRDGRLVIPCDHNVADTPRPLSYYSHVIYSDDDGQTWKIGGSAGPETNESAVVQLADGSLMLNMRSYAGQHRRAVSISRDGGLTWSPVRLDPALIEPVCEASFICYTRRGRSLLLFSNPADVVRDRLTVRLSYNGGRTWPVSRLVDPDFSEYSSLAVLKDGTIGLLYDCGPGKPSATHAWYAPQDSEIDFAHFNLEWLTRGTVRPAEGRSDNR